MFPDIFNDDAFSLVALTALINEADHVPGRAGELAFTGVGEGVTTLTVSIEQIGESLSLIPTTARHAPAPQEQHDKGTLRAVGIPQVKLEDTIPASMVQDVRQLGSTNTLRGVQSVISQQVNKMSLRHDLTLEHLRLGALRGKVLDSTGREIVDLYSFFGVSEPDVIDFDGLLADSGTEVEYPTARTRAHEITRYMSRNLKAPLPSSARVWALCGDNFFDRLVESPSIKNVYDGYAAAEKRLGANYAHSVFEFGGIMFENYRGTDDNSTVAISTNEARFFLTGVPGLYAEYYAPADFLETTNTVGLPRYAKVAPDGRFNRSVALHTQQNPLPICTRPRTLVKATVTPGG